MEKFRTLSEQELAMSIRKEATEAKDKKPELGGRLESCPLVTHAMHSQVVAKRYFRFGIL